MDNHKNKENLKTMDPSDICKDPSDGRKIKEYQSRYPVEINKRIKGEAYFLIVLLVIVCVIGIAIGIQYKSQIIKSEFTSSKIVYCYCFAWVGGMIGGIVFSSKWLYHTVAKGLWNEDRWLWRKITPILSGITAVMFLVILYAFQCSEPYNIHECCGIGFLVGYFSDDAIGKLSEIAKVLFARHN